MTVSASGKRKAPEIKRGSSVSRRVARTCACGSFWATQSKIGTEIWANADATAVVGLVIRIGLKLIMLGSVVQVHLSHQKYLKPLILLSPWLFYCRFSSKVMHKGVTHTAGVPPEKK